MDLNVKKDLTSNWFKTLQNSICYSISNLEKNKIEFETKKKMKVEVNTEYLKMEKYSTKSE